MFGSLEFLGWFRFVGWSCLGGLFVYFIKLLLFNYVCFGVCLGTGGVTSELPGVCARNPQQTLLTARHAGTF